MTNLCTQDVLDWQRAARWRRAGDVTPPTRREPEVSPVEPDLKLRLRDLYADVFIRPSVQDSRWAAFNRTPGPRKRWHRRRSGKERLDL